MTTESSSESLVFTIREVAQKLSLSRGSVYEAIRRHELPALSIGRRVLVPKSALLKMLEAGAAATAQPGKGELA